MKLQALLALCAHGICACGEDSRHCIDSSGLWTVNIRLEKAFILRLYKLTSYYALILIKIEKCGHCFYCIIAILSNIVIISSTIIVRWFF
jgi:hypothetical protein